MLSQLQSVGEDALGRLAKSPATRTALTSALQLKDRAGKTLSGLEGVESRLDAVEKRLAALEGKAKKTTARSTTRKTASKPAAAKTPAAEPASTATPPAS